MDRMDRRDRGFRRAPSAPIKVGDIVDVTIEAVGEKGDGLAKVSGFVIFVPGVKQGDQLKIKITKVLRSVGFGEVVGSGSGESTAETKKPSQDEDGGDSGENYAEEGYQEGSEGAAEESEDSENF